MQMHSIFLASTVLAIWMGPVTAMAQPANEPPATFLERYPVERTVPQPAQPSAQPTATTPQSTATTPQTTAQSTAARPQRNVTAPVRAFRAERPRTRVVVVPRSFLDAGTQVQPGQERKFLDYAYPPLYQPYNAVTNIGGRVGWHNSPLPGPFFPYTN
jgi:hypothetical protein